MGGQSIPLFDHYLGAGVAKTIVNEYIELLEDVCNIDTKVLRELKKKLRLYVDKNKRIITEEGKTFVRIRTLADIPTLKLLKVSKVIGEYNETLDFNNGMFEDLWKKAIEKADRQTFKAMESLIHNLNTMHSRAGSQTPFYSINYGTDISEEGRMVIKNVMLATEKGLGNGETPIFPIQIFKVKEGVNYNEGDPNYDLYRLSMYVSARTFFPNYVFLDAPFNLQYYKKGIPETEVTTMGCRTRVQTNTYDKTKEISVGRGNASFTTINLPGIAMEVGKGNIDKFFDVLDSRLSLVRDQLKIRLNYQANKKVYNFPFLMGQGVWIDSEKLSNTDTLGDIVKQGTLGVGFIGLAECLKYLIGSHHGESVEAQELGLKIVQHMREYTDSISEEDGLTFGLLGTPAEGLSDRFLKIDRRRYGVIEGVTDREYYTNSNHVPVYHHIGGFDKIMVEAPYHALTNAGHITYIELDGESAKDEKKFEAILKCMHDYNIGYGAINHPVDRCRTCNYKGTIAVKCPKCGDTDIARIRRITGYLVGDLDRFGDGKRNEEKDRVKHGMREI